MTADSESAPESSTVASAQRPMPETPTFAMLRAHAAATLRTEAGRIGVRWEAQSRTVALREPREAVPAVPAEQAATTATVAALVESVAQALASDGTTSDDLVALGLAFGMEAFERGGSLHHVLKGLDLLAAMTLYAVETGLVNEPDATAADGVRIARRLQQAWSLLTLAATKAYTQSMSEGMRDRFRHLRHDLRNPLGTIKSVLAMMDDESMPAEARTHPRFRAMAARNARSLGDLIADRLSDAQAIPPTLAQQSASLRTIACGVRRDLRAEADARAATVVVGSARTRVMVDAVGLELMLHELLLAALQDATPGDELSLEFADAHGDRAVVTLVCVPARPPVADASALARLSALATRMSGELEVGDQTLSILVPVQRVELTVPTPRAASVDAPSDAPPSVPAATSDAVLAIAPAITPVSSGREPSYDLGSASERQHRQPRPL